MALYDICYLRFNHIGLGLPAGYIHSVQPAGFVWGIGMRTDPLDVWHDVELTDAEHADVHGRKVRVDRFGGRGVAHKIIEAEEKHRRGYQKPEKQSKGKAKKTKAAAVKAAKVPTAKRRRKVKA